MQKGLELASDSRNLTKSLGLIGRNAWNNGGSLPRAATPRTDQKGLLVR